MNIMIINDGNPFYGSGIVGLDLYKEFRKKGYSVRLLVNEYLPHYPEEIICIETFYLFWQKKILNRLKKILKIKADTIPTDPKYRFHELNEKKIYYETKVLLKKAGIQPDVIFVLFAKEFINPKNIYELGQKTNAPIYWIMYDMAPFTGGCHYAWDCKGYQNNCGKCPGLFSSDPFDLTYENLLFKKEYISKTKIQIIAGSEWQFRQAKNSSLFCNKPVHKILLPIDPSVFKPVGKEEARLKFGVSSDKKVVFFGSVGLSDQRKGMAYLIESLKILKDLIKRNDPDLEHRILLLIAGERSEGIAGSLPFESLYLGLLDNTFGIASAFQAADIFVCPSIEDSGPMMINQSIMCGTPVVSFEMGVALDLVKNGETGYRAKIKDSAGLAQGIYNILTIESDKYKMLSNKCRDLAMKMCSPDVQMENLESLILNSAASQVGDISNSGERFV
jgi:glycosyltransferase involved in cell wall biosynthesis